MTAIAVGTWATPSHIGAERRRPQVSTAPVSLTAPVLVRRHFIHENGVREQFLWVTHPGSDAESAHPLDKVIGLDHFTFIRWPPSAISSFTPASQRIPPRRQSWTVPHTLAPSDSDAGSPG
ncbi:hypothetical protein GCM10009579_43010 [Streptomyces javensis]|uniref:Uncharacterized protein n=1 Tax=Streptomyces javensis TaxID=114698 RepID=A0ABN1X1P2_9ACTN